MGNRNPALCPPQNHQQVHVARPAAAYRWHPPSCTILCRGHTHKSLQLEPELLMNEKGNVPRNMQREPNSFQRDQMDGENSQQFNYSILLALEGDFLIQYLNPNFTNSK
jgi:hypothetical protein